MDNIRNIRHFCKLYILLIALCAAGSIQAQGKIYYVTPTGIGADAQNAQSGTGASWTDAMLLPDALDAAVAGDQIWVLGFEEINAISKVYIAPAGGFQLKSGVQLYGGFKGDETNIDDREITSHPYKLTYRSVLSGDIGMDDAGVDETNLIFPTNDKRDNNATHVLSVNMTPTQQSGNDNNYPTIINGFTIAAGHADGTGENGGGIYIYGDNAKGGIYRIERCFLFNNYANLGGAIYVDAAVKNVNNGTSLINQCVVYNNAAGQRTAQSNSGGGIYVAGAGTVVNTAVFNNENGGICISTNAQVVNSTITRNSGGGIDMTTQPPYPNPTVFNSVIWGNSELYSLYCPDFRNSAYSELETTDGNGNIPINSSNNDDGGPHFTSPSTRTSYDRTYNWMHSAYPLWSWDVQEQSGLIDQGSNSYYDDVLYGNADLIGETRFAGSTIDIGADEYQPVANTRIRYVKAGGTGAGTSWADASGNLQQMINDLADNNPQNMIGEVWVAAGTYTPQTQVISGTTYSATFRMRDGISVYGGFKGDETSKLDRVQATGGMPWEYANHTILQATYYSNNNASWNTADYKWTLASDSRHVVWFAPLPDEGATGFTNVTHLSGVTVRGGYAQGGAGLDDFLTDRGAGVYMAANAYLENCIVTENTATGNGGGVYMKGGQVRNSLIYNNNADENGGGVYMENSGLVLASMLTNNSADNGAGAYLDQIEPWTDGQNHPEYLIVSTSVVSNNTSRLNGALYCNKGGVILQTTITNNFCPTATDNTSAYASQTGGLYINQYGLIINSVIWNNIIQGKNIPMYAQNPTADKVRFLYTAASGTSNAVWNNTLQQSMISLQDGNTDAANDGKLAPNFTTAGLPAGTGVQGAWKYNNTDNTTGITYYWKPEQGSNLRAQGMPIGNMPDEVMLSPEKDIEGQLFAQKPAVGAFRVEAMPIVHETTANALIVYVDINCTDPTHDGSSWDKAYRSLNEAISYLAALDATTVGTGTNQKRLEVHAIGATMYPAFAFTDLDPKSATIQVPTITSGATLHIYGGYAYTNPDRTQVERAPLQHRSIIDGNQGGNALADGIYHCITIAKDAHVVLDGFHVINGYAAIAPQPYGAGLLVNDGANVTVQNCIFENNTATIGAAIDARNATLTLTNCVINNNTNTTDTEPVINCANLTLNHVTIVNNIGAAPANVATANTYATSFSAGNTSNNTLTVDDHGIASTNADGAKHFANPTNRAGATMGFDTYLGGYSNFRPLTSSTEAGTHIINQVTTNTAVANLDNDITVVNDRNLGGLPDLGAYEADLPKAGRIIYVKEDATENGTGLSWQDPKKGVNNAVNAALDYNATLTPAQLADPDQRAQVWIAAGEYSTSPGASGTTLSCFAIRDGVDVLGAFPATGTPGLEDRRPLLSDKIYTGEDPNVVQQYETILTTNTGTGRILGAPDDCNPYDGNTAFTYETTWDGFTITGGNLQLTHNRAGGGGAQIFKNMNLKNCVVANNTNKANGTNQQDNARGGGIFCDQGSIINCYIINNKMLSTGDNGAYYGGGAYLYNGTMYNCVVANNYIYARYADGAGLFLEAATFYNNTIVNNKAENAPNTSTVEQPRRSGGLTVWNSGGGGTLYLYNCILAGNEGFYEIKGNKNIAATKGTIQFYNCLLNTDVPTSTVVDGDVTITYNSCKNYTAADAVATGSSLAWTDIFEAVDVDNFDQSNYRLKNPLDIGVASPAVNTGENIIYETGADGNLTTTVLVDLFTFTDMDFTDRIKDCQVDIGAYERNNADNIAPEMTGNAGVFYVTQNGKGLSNASSLTNAACAMKLQEVLNAAGECAAKNPGNTYTVKIAGYQDNADGTPGFVYHANTLSDANDPQSYTYTIPYGVTVKGGYNDLYSTWNDALLEWLSDMYQPSIYKTRLSAIYEGASQDVNGYHVLTFDVKPDGWSGSSSTLVDGLYLQDGNATSGAGAGSPKTRGGGAIVPAGVHVRNCVVGNCAAIEGGGLYIQPGAMVSGTVVYHNTADNGGGIYADNTPADGSTLDASNRAHIISCTVTDNTASTTGGGIFMEDGAAMVLNSVFWGNTAQTDINISATVANTYRDALWSNNLDLGDIDYYPFNHCYVETYDLPANYENNTMTSEADVYFAGADRTLKDYSPLVDHGVSADIYTDLIAAVDVAFYDMQNVTRIENGTTDVGAYAYMVPTNFKGHLITVLFVSQGSNTIVTGPTNISTGNYGGNSANCDPTGRTFYAPLTSLEDAFDYIRTARATSWADENTHFDILVAGGTYTPSQQRILGDTRTKSFDIPHNVSIYGGFSGTEKYSSSVTHEIFNATTGNTTYSSNALTGVVTSAGETIDLIPLTDVTTASGDPVLVLDVNTGTILKYTRNVKLTMPHNAYFDTLLLSRSYSDFNQNGIYDPWELANQTILSGTNQNLYHVLYSEWPATNTGTPNPVVLDGITVMGGQANSLTTPEDTYGGGLYTNGVPYILNRCRFLNNQAEYGGAIYAHSAEVTPINTIFAGNSATNGGALYLESGSKQAKLNAVNTLWVNNENATNGSGGAIATKYAGLSATATAPAISLMNNTIVRNGGTSAIDHQGDYKITNTVIWGNDGTMALPTPGNITYSASDESDLQADFGGTNLPKLSTDNMAAAGPHFTRPSATTGVSGNSANSMWNPIAISVLTDAGDGHIDITKTPKDTVGAHEDWLDDNNITPFQRRFMMYSDSVDYKRYAGPALNLGQDTIDIGLYEYQYRLDGLDTLYVATIESGRGDGTSWANATSDLRGAIAAMANPRGKVNTTDKVILIKAGTYSLSQLSAGIAYSLSMSSKDANANGTSLTIKGSYNNSGLQDFSQPTVITTNPTVANQTSTLLQIDPNDKPVTIEGITFRNENENGGDGITLNITKGKGTVTLKNVAFRHNTASGVNVIQNDGNLIIVNALFADGNTGLTVQKGHTTAPANTIVVNATFANNVTDLDDATKFVDVYNTVAWNNATQNIVDDPTNKHNVAFAAGTPNNDLLNGPNFKDPDNEDYSLSPSRRLQNQGDTDHYISKVPNVAQNNIKDEKDLGNNQRQMDNDIDVGAYEFEAPLQPIIYVKADIVGTKDGTSWTTALDNLQDAVNMAGLYADNTGNRAYVFVHSNYTHKDKGTLTVLLPNIRVYGTMNDETSTETATIDIVNELLGKRKGLLESAKRSVLEDVTIDNTTGNTRAMLDGFEINGTATINNGIIATSILKKDVGGNGDGYLYNSLVKANVTGVRTINVTATGTIENVNGSANNRPSVTVTNTYVTDDYWNYQLMETSGDIDDGDDNYTKDIGIMYVGHSRDLIGNQRIRKTVDNGCFETWNVPEGETMQVTATDYPIGKSVVYVRKGAELVIENDANDQLVYPDAASAFNPGFLLLEHQAGLRGNGNFIKLTNLAVERDIAAGGADLVAMPFDVDDQNSVTHGLTPKRYNGSTRAAYAYKFDSDNSTAWEDYTIAQAGLYEGLLFENTGENAVDLTLRFYGKSANPYTEDGNAKIITLNKYNFNTPWASPSDQVDKFTHKENMSWNLFGSPFLCALNYQDLEYGRVVYGYDGGYLDAVRTYAIDGGNPPNGYIPAGNAVFTQSATLKDTEQFKVSAPTGAKNTGGAFKSLISLSIYIGRQQASVLTGKDNFVLETVSSAEASTDFDLGADGVKWMSGNDVPQIYVVRNGGRYSLLSAVDVEGTTRVGVSVPAAGNYQIGVAQDSDKDKYEAVILTDYANGKKTDLLYDTYTFTATEAGTVDDRFTLTFRPLDGEETDNPVVYLYPGRRVLIRGMVNATHVAAYDAAGRLIQQLPVENGQVWFYLPQGFYLFNIRYADNTAKALKAVVH